MKNTMKVASALTIVSMLFAGTTAYANGDVTVKNTNNAVVTNGAWVSADTGNNTANGGAGDNGGNGGDAKGSGDNTAGKGGNGGDGGNGGLILTGNASAVSTIMNDVNYNQTEVEIEDCGCEQGYMKSTWEKDTSLWKGHSEEWDNEWSSKEHEEASEKKDGKRGYGDYRGKKGGSSSHWEKTSEMVDNEKGSKDFMLDKTTHEKTTDEFRPVEKGDVEVENDNNAVVTNNADAYAGTGENYADGDDAGKGGNGGDAIGDKDDKYKKYGRYNRYGGYGRNHRGNDDSNTGGNGGNGGDGGEGGVIETGTAATLSDMMSLVNRNITRVVRN